MLNQWWPAICDVEPATNQQWVTLRGSMKRHLTIAVPMPGETAHDAGPSLTQRFSSLLCYLRTVSTPFTAWPEGSQIYFLLETYIFYSGNNYTFFLEGKILLAI